MTPLTTLFRELAELNAKATPGPWEGCNHVKDHSFDKQCKCGQATIWSRPADTIVCQKYVNDDGSGPEPVSREQELQNMSLIIALRNAFPRILEERQELKRKIEGMKRVDKNIFSARIVNDEWVREIQVNPIVSTYNEAIDDVLKLFEE